MKTLGKITTFILLTIIGFVVGLLKTYIILSVAKLFELNFITQFSFLQFYGIMCVWDFLFYKYKKEEKEESFNESMKNNTIRILSTLFIYLCGWGLSFISYYILK